MAVLVWDVLQQRFEVRQLRTGQAMSVIWRQEQALRSEKPDG